MYCAVSGLSPANRVFTGQVESKILYTIVIHFVAIDLKRLSTAITESDSDIVLKITLGHF